MNRAIIKCLSVASLLLALSCTKNNTGNPDPVELPDITPSAASGITIDPALPDADKPCTIWFEPTSTSSVSSELYNNSGDIYVHIGIIKDGEWAYVPATWNQNIAKCRMTRVGDNSYKLELTPSIREYFGSGTTPLTKLAMVMRNAAGTKQTRPDQFNSVKDTKYQEEVFQPDEVEYEPLPAGMKPGININSTSSVTLVLYDKKKDGTHYDYSYVIGPFSNWKRESAYAMKRDDASGCWWITLAGLDSSKEYMYQYHIGDKTTDIRINDAFSETVYDPWNDKYISSSTYPSIPAYPSETKERVGSFKINRTPYSWQVEDYCVKDKDNVVIYELLLRDFTSTKDLNGAIAKLDYLKELGVGAIELMPVQEFEGNDSWGYNPCAYFALDKAYGTPIRYKQFVDECHKRDMAVLLDVVYNQATGAHPFARMYWNSDASNVSASNPFFNVTCPHDYGVFQDWNHENPQTVDLVERSLGYLLTEYHIDGFRFDLTKGFTNNRGKENAYDQLRVDILKEYNRYVLSVKPDAMVILEHFVDQENDTLGAEGMHVWGNCNGTYSQVIRGGTPDLAAMYDPKCIKVGYMESHDEERLCIPGNGDLVTRMKRAALAAAFTFMVPGPKMIWQFGEMGYDVSINNNGRTGAKPLHWEYLEVSERKALHDSYATLLKFRNEHPQFFTKGAAFSWKVGSGTVLKTLSCTAGGKHIIIAGNFSGSQTLTFQQMLPVECEWKNAMSGESLGSVSEVSKELKPGEFLFITDCLQ